MSSSNVGFTGFFSESTSAKQLFQTVLNHMVYCVKKKGATQKDAEQVLTKAVINFKATAFEYNFIADYLSDTLKRAISGDQARPSDTSLPDESKKEVKA